MSALIAILTLSPLALRIGRGSGVQRPLATAILFGLAIGAALVLTMLQSLVLVFTNLTLRRKPASSPDPLSKPA